jgi:hypothetical protein
MGGQKIAENFIWTVTVSIGFVLSKIPRINTDGILDYLPDLHIIICDIIEASVWAAAGYYMTCILRILSAKFKNKTNGNS